MASGQDKNNAVFRLELALGLVLTLVLIGLHVTFLRHAGGLWRDEVQIVNLGNMTSFAELWEKSEHDSFPIAWPIVVRLWTALGFGKTDSGLRFLGMLIGLGIIGLQWWVARQFRVSVPFTMLILFALSPTVLVYADSLRGYGLGVLSMFFMVGAFRRMVEKPSRKRIGLALLAAVLAVQSMYFNAVLLFAAGTGGAAVALRRRNWRLVFSLLVVGTIAALSLLPYCDPLSRQYRWNAIVKAPVNYSWLFRIFTQAITASGDFMFFIWIVVFLVALFACSYRLWHVEPNKSDTHTDKALFLPSMMIVGIVSYAVFLRRSDLPTQVWYYVAIMGFLSVAMDVSIDLLISGNWIGRSIRMGAAMILAALVLPAAWKSAHVRFTNVDLIAAKLESVAGPKDLILFPRWWPGITFARYYRGKASWTTLPEIADMSVQRFDLLKKKMAEMDPIGPLHNKIIGTLASGHRLWVVGILPPLNPGEMPGQIAPLPAGPMEQEPYLTVWTRQTTWLLQQHIRKYTQVEVLCPDPVLPFENIPLYVAEGWN